VGEWHKVGGFISGVSNHEPLVSGSDFFVLLVLVHTLRDFGRLLVNGNDDGCSFVVHSDLVGVIPHILDGLSGDLLEVHVAGGADFSEHHADRVFDSALACDLGLGILLEAGVEDRVGDIVAKFVGMPLGDIFGGEEEVACFRCQLLAVHEFIILIDMLNNY